MQNEEITGDSKYVAKYGHLAKYGSSLYIYAWNVNTWRRKSVLHQTTEYQITIVWYMYSKYAKTKLARFMVSTL